MRWIKGGYICRATRICKYDLSWITWEFFKSFGITFISLRQSKFRGIIWCLSLWGGAIPPLYHHWGTSLGPFPVCFPVQVYKKVVQFLAPPRKRPPTEHLLLGDILILRAVFSIICIVFRDRMFRRHVFYIHTIFKSSLLLIRNGCRLYKCLLSL